MAPPAQRAPASNAGAFDEVFRWVRRIPRGRVMTYGQISELIDRRLTARAVGWAMHGCPASVPWQRVVNASGGCSTDDIPGNPPGLQRALLEEEGVEFRAGGKLDLKRYRYAPRTPSTPAARRGTAPGKPATGGPKARKASATPTGSRASKSSKAKKAKKATKASKARQAKTRAQASSRVAARRPSD